MRLMFVLLFAFAVVACEKKEDRRISIYFENNSDFSSLDIDVYLNGDFCKTIIVPRDSTKIYDASLVASYVERGNENLQLKFLIKSTGDTVSFIGTSKQIDSIDYIHVNYIETVLRKGFVVYNRVLNKDSVAYKSFYCEPVFRRGKASISVIK